MSELTDLETQLSAARKRFLAIVEDLRPELHRYCARMTGSVTEGEEIVQESLAQAYYSLSTSDEIVNLRAWLFRIAHNKAVDFLRRYDVRHSVSLDERDEAAEVPDDPVVRAETTQRAMSTFVRVLIPKERACVILKDVLDHSLSEIAHTLDITVPAVKAALHRGRQKLKREADSPRSQQANHSTSSRLLRRYVELFNARDWDGLRSLLAEDARLDVVDVAQRRGKPAIERYFVNYESAKGWRAAVRELEGRELIVLYEADGEAWSPRSLIRIEEDGAYVTAIVDYRQVRYMLQDVDVPPPDVDS